MPVTVVVRSASGGIAPSLTLDGDRIVIGRSDGSDLRLPDPSVSLRHATLRAQGAEYALVDEGSTNGTWVGGVKLGPRTPRLVKSGDLLRVGRVWLEVFIGQKAVTPDLGLATRELALALVRNAMDAVGDETGAKIAVAEGPDIGDELRLTDEGRAYLIGRGESCDLPLADEDASREHVSIVRRGTQILLRDLGSRNGVYLGESRITPERDVVWRPPAMVRIGRSVLSLDEPVSLALGELEAAADEPLADEDAPQAPPSSMTALPAAQSSSGPAGPPTSGEKPASSDGPESRFAHQAPIVEVGSRTAPTVIRRGRRVWTAADVMVVTIAIGVISVSIAGLVWVLR